MYKKKLVLEGVGGFDSSTVRRFESSRVRRFDGSRFDGSTVRQFAGSIVRRFEFRDVRATPSVPVLEPVGAESARGKVECARRRSCLREEGRVYEKSGLREER